MIGFEENTRSRENPVFRHDENNLPEGMSRGDDSFVMVSYPLWGENTLPASSPQGNSCRDIPLTKNDNVNYPGRSVLYSRQFRPLNRILSTENKTPLSGEP